MARFTPDSLGHLSLRKIAIVGSAAVMNEVVKYDSGRFGLNDISIALNINKLLNREYVASCFQAYGCSWGAERQAVATATFRF